MSQSDPQSEHVYVFEILPWWITNTLEKDDAERVKKHLESCSLCKAEVAFIESTGIFTDAEATSELRAEATDALAVSIKNPQQNSTAEVDAALSSVMSQINAESSNVVSLDAHKKSSTPAKTQKNTEKTDAKEPGGFFRNQYRLFAVAACCAVVAMLAIQLYQEEPSRLEGNGYSVLGSDDVPSSSQDKADKNNGGMRFSMSVISPERNEINSVIKTVHGIAQTTIDDPSNQITVEKSGDSKTLLMTTSKPLSVDDVSILIEALDQNDIIDRVSLSP